MPLKKGNAKPSNTETDDKATDTEHGAEANAESSQKEESPKKDVKAQSGTELVTEKENAAVATITSFMKDADDDGFEGMEIGRGSFTAITLDSGEFTDATTSEALELEDEDGEMFNLKDGFFMVPVTSRKKMVHKLLPMGVNAEKDDIDIMVTYGDEDKTHTGESLAQIKANLEDDGGEIQTSVYLELVGTILKPQDDGGYDPEDIIDLAVLSIAPLSRQKVTGSIAKYNALHRTDPVKKISNAVIKVGVGKKTKRGKNTYHPWAFKCAGKVS